MNQECELLERQVLGVLQQMRTEYQAMQVLIDQLDFEQSGWDRFEATSAQIRNRTTELERLDLETRELKTAYRNSRSQASAEVSQSTSELAREMETFLIKLNRLENAAQKSRQGMIPQLQAGVRSVKMQAAYGQYVDT